MDGEQLSIDIAVEANSPRQEAVECLGMTFANDEERRAYFTERLREKLRDPEFRKIEGFPIGEDKDILALSDPPYYTACPNPFIEEFVNYWNSERGDSSGSEDNGYHREPFAADVSEGKNDPIYNAHSYHTKVPHKAIVRYILHYTQPGDIVFDGFCGSGMTGVAAQLCGYKATVESLGYRVLGDGTILDEEGKAFSKLGARRVILNDLSPAATFIAYNYNTPVDVAEFEREAKRILSEVENECGWMYLTLHNPTSNQLEQAFSLLKNSNNLQGELQNYGLLLGRINYTIWSDVFTCPECTNEIVYWDVAVDKEAGKVEDSFLCPHCKAKLTKRNMERAWTTRFDSAINQTIKQTKQVPVLINYKVKTKNFNKELDAFDRAIIEKIENYNITGWFPTDRMPEGEESRRNDGTGITHVHHFYTKRDLVVIGKTLQKSLLCKTKSLLILSITSLLNYSSKLCRWRTANKSGPLSGTLYISSTIMPLDAFTILPKRYKRMSEAKRCFVNKNLNIASVSTNSTTALFIPSNSLDYIFTDPPFGNNLMYSELNFLTESWLKIFTNNELEVIENKVQGKKISEYHKLIEQCFHEYYRVLKPGHWITVEFHNSKNIGEHPNYAMSNNT